MRIKLAITLIAIFSHVGAAYAFNGERVINCTKTANGMRCVSKETEEPRITGAKQWCLYLPLFNSLQCNHDTKVSCSRTSLGHKCFKNPRFEEEEE